MIALPEHNSAFEYRRSAIGDWRGGITSPPVGLIQSGNRRVETMIKTWSSFCIAMVVAAAVASPALAQSSRKKQPQRSPQAAPYNAYGGQKRYTDPDPNVQFEI